MGASALKTQYLLPDGVSATAARELIASHLDVESDRARSVEQRFYDTFDGRLHAKGLTLVHQDGRLVLRDGSGYAQSSAEMRSAPRRLFVSELPPGPLRDALEPVAQVRALTALARVKSRLQTMRVLDDELKTVVRLEVEEPSLMGPGGAKGRLEPRVGLLPVRGYDGELGRVRQTLQRELGLTETPLSLQDEAVGAAGGTPGGISAKLRLRLEPGERADRAAAIALAAPLSTMSATLPGTLADVDSEFLHDFRVAVRRTRSLQRQLEPLFPPDAIAHFRAEFKWLQQVTGTVRDLDVHLIALSRFRSEAPSALAADLGPLQEMLSERRAKEFRQMARALRSKRTSELLDGWSALLDGLPEADAERGREPIEAVVAARIRSVYRRMVKMGKAIDDASPPEALHDLRKKGKELRYLLEFFGGLYPEDVVRPMVRALKGLQDVLGRYQDQEVQAATLRSLRHDLGGREGGAAALMAMGVLVESLRQDHAAARGEFAEKFAPFAAKRQLRLVERAFG